MNSKRYSLWFINYSGQNVLLALSNDFDSLKDETNLSFQYLCLIKDRETPYTASEAQLAADLGCADMVEYGHVVYRSRPSQNTP